VIPTLTGYLFIRWFWPVRQTLQGQFVLQLALAVGIGLGMSSCLLFAWLILSGIPAESYPLIETVFLACVSVLLLVAPRRQPSSIAGETRPVEKDTFRQIANALLVAGVVVKLLHFVFQSLTFPHGEHGDAWYIWNMRARFLYRGGEDWRDAFHKVVGW